MGMASPPFNLAVPVEVKQDEFMLHGELLAKHGKESFKLSALCILTFETGHADFVERFVAPVHVSDCKVQGPLLVGIDADGAGLPPPRTSCWRSPF